MNRLKILLVLIFLLASFLRVFNFTSNPPALYWDEVSQGYNAYSMLTTGADEYGHKLPLLFESFQEYKLPGYIYLLVPFISVFGLNETAVRMPSIIAGILAVFGIYLLASLLINKKIALLSAILLAISPWHLQFSRTGFEANTALTLIIFGVYFIIKSFKTQKRLALGIFLLSLSLYFYNSAKTFVPLIFLLLPIVFYREIININRKEKIWSVLVLIVTVIPLVVTYLNPGTLNRLSYVSVFSDKSVIAQSVNERVFDNGGLIPKALHQRYFVYLKEILRNYFSHFSFDFLFLAKENNLRHFVPGSGYFYLWQFIGLIAGLFALLKNRIAGRLLLVWVIIAPVSAAIALPAPHALRTLFLLPAIIIIVGVGLVRFVNSFDKLTARIIILMFVVVSIFELISYLHQYYVHYPTYSSREWAYGYKEVFNYLKNNISADNKVYVTGQYWRPYIFALFYLNYSPDLYQHNIQHQTIGNIYFGHASYDDSDKYYDYKNIDTTNKILHADTNSVYVIAPEEKQPGDIIFKEIDDLQNKPLFLFVKKNNLFQ